MPKVFFVNEVPASSSIDLRSAEEFGTPVYLSDTSRPSALATDGLIESLLAQLAEHNYEPGIDFVVLTGRLTDLVMLVAGLAACDDITKFLIYSPKVSTYLPRTVNWKLLNERVLK